MSKKPKAAAETNMSKSALVPKLRFPEFRNAPEWEGKTLGNICQIYKGKGISKADISPDGITPCIRYGELYTIYSEVIDAVRSRTNCSPENLFLSKGNDVIIPASGETKEDIATASCVLHDDIALGGDLNVIRTNHNGIFFSYYLNGPLSKKIAKVAQGDTVVHLYPSQLSVLDVMMPDSREQQKIADCLSSVDKLISAQAEKVEALKAHKKGLMQLLFPAKGATLPKLRFPEFRNAPEWAESKLNKFIEEFRENSTIQDQHQVLTSARTGLIRQSEYYENSRLTKRDNVGFNILPPNYITYRSRSDDGLFFFNENNLGITGIVSIYYPVFRIVGGNNKFFISLLSCYAEVIGRKSVGNAQKVLSMNVLKEIILPVPSPAEQKKIADCLSSVDDLLTVQMQKLEALKAHKKGLMQQLFPVPEMVE